jgi:hypothetical protein
MKITKEQVNRLYDDRISKKEYDEIIELIDERFGDVVTLILPKITQGDGWFVYGNYRYEDENNEGHFDIDQYKNEICIGGNCLFPEPYCFTDQGNGYIPTRWLWTDDDDILKEFHRKVERAKKETQKRKDLAAQKRQELQLRKAKFKAIIQSKLTKEELRYISFK